MACASICQGRTLCGLEAVPDSCATLVGLIPAAQVCERHAEYLDWLWSSQEITSYSEPGAAGKGE